MDGCAPTIWKHAPERNLSERSPRHHHVPFLSPCLPFILSLYFMFTCLLFEFTSISPAVLSPSSHIARAYLVFYCFRLNFLFSSSMLLCYQISRIKYLATSLHSSLRFRAIFNYIYIIRGKLLDII